MKLGSAKLFSLPCLAFPTETPRKAVSCALSSRVLQPPDHTWCFSMALCAVACHLLSRTGSKKIFFIDISLTVLSLSHLCVFRTRAQITLFPSFSPSSPTGASPHCSGSTPKHSCLSGSLSCFFICLELSSQLLAWFNAFLQDVFKGHRVPLKDSSFPSPSPTFSWHYFP